MDAGIEKKIGKPFPKKTIYISLIAFIILMSALTGLATFKVLSYDKIYSGVYVNGLDVGSLKRDELSDLLKKEFQDKAKNITITVKSADFMEKINLADIDLSYDISSSVDKAYEVGRSGNIFGRLFDVLKSSKNESKLEMPISYNKEKVESVINSLYEKTLVKVKQPELIIGSSNVVIRSGHHGQHFDKGEALKKIEASILKCSDETINLATIRTIPDKINVDEFIKKINTEPVDASVKVDKNKITILPHVIGKKVDRGALTSLVAVLEGTEDTERSLPIATVNPKILTQDINAKLFKDTLYTMSTRFSTSTTNDANRGVNIRLAVSKINGTILGPGQVFSFNDIVGPRSAANGYKVAHVYSRGKVIDDVGGGICQVSTTLYNAILFSDLQTVSRTPHMFTVGYVPYGRDAAVSYGSLDFKFKNSTKLPIKIEGTVSKDNKIFFTLKGTKEDPKKAIDLVTKTVKTIDFQTKYIDDPTLEVGKTVVKQKGSKGYVIDTYKITKLDGKIVSEVKLHTSKYNPLTQEIRRGTKKALTPTPQPKNVTATNTPGKPLPTPANTIAIQATPKPNPQ
ncbi:MAG: VanW family protein [Clostridia bacterium]|nr:VanW family protein [Clostridia bacterium]